MTIPEVIPIVNVRWDDILFLILATVMIGSALLVVILRDIIRCGLAMMVCFGALAGIYVIAGAPLVAATQVLVYIGAMVSCFACALGGPDRRTLFMIAQAWNGPENMFAEPRTGQVLMAEAPAPGDGWP